MTDFEAEFRREMDTYYQDLEARVPAYGEPVGSPMAPVSQPYEPSTDHKVLSVRVYSDAAAWYYRQLQEEHDQAVAKAKADAKEAIEREARVQAKLVELAERKAAREQRRAERQRRAS